MCDAAARGDSAATRRRRFPLHFALARFQHPRDCLSRPPDAESPTIGFSWQWLTPAPSDASAASSTATYTMARRTICSPTSTSMVSARTTKQSAERCPRIARPRKPRPPASAPVRAPQCRNVFKPYDRRLEREGFVESEEDDPQIIIHIPFISPVKIRALSVIGGADGETPRELRAFINRETLDFSDADALAAPVSAHSPPTTREGAPLSRTHPSGARFNSGRLLSETLRAGSSIRRRCSRDSAALSRARPLTRHTWRVSQYSRFQSVSRLSLFVADNHGEALAQPMTYRGWWLSHHTLRASQAPTARGSTTLDLRAWAPTTSGARFKLCMSSSQWRRRATSRPSARSRKWSDTARQRPSVSVMG